MLETARPLIGRNLHEPRSDEGFGLRLLVGKTKSPLSRTEAACSLLLWTERPSPLLLPPNPTGDPRGRACRLP